MASVVVIVSPFLIEETSFMLFPSIRVIEYPRFNVESGDSASNRDSRLSRDAFFFSMFTPIDKLKYSEALAELESIVRTLQSDNCDIDRLTILTQRATELLSACRSRLTATDNELRSILSSLENEQA